MSKIYKVPIIWQSCRVYEVEAEELQSACYQALKQFLSEPDDEYLCDSFEIDSDIEEEYKEEYSWLTLMENL